MHLTATGTEIDEMSEAEALWRSGRRLARALLLSAASAALLLMTACWTGESPRIEDIVAVSSTGDLFSIEFHRVTKFTSDGEFIKSWGKFGDDKGKFQSPSAITVDSNDNVYVTERGNPRVQKFTADGRFLARWGREGDALGQLANPTSIAVDSSGNVYVSDYETHRVQKFTPEGEFLSQLGNEPERVAYRYPTNDREFLRPTELFLDAADNVYVSDAPKNSSSLPGRRIQKFGPDGEYLGTWNGGNAADRRSGDWNVFVDPQGDVYNVQVGIGVSCCVRKFTWEGDLLTEWGESPTAWLTGIEAVDDRGHVYMGHGRYQSPSPIVKYAADGTLVWSALD
jgi:hypothetical protein